MSRLTPLPGNLARSALLPRTRKLAPMSAQLLPAAGTELTDVQAVEVVLVLADDEAAV